MGDCGIGGPYLLLSYPTCVGIGCKGSSLSLREGPGEEYGTVLFVGFGGGGGGRSLVNGRGEAGLGIDRPTFGGSGGIGGGRGGAFCCCLDITGGSFAKTSLRMARKSSTLDFYIPKFISISAK